MDKQSVLDLVAQQKPKFQLDSNSSALHSSEHFFYQRGATGTDDLVRASHELENESAQYLASCLRPEFVTVEVGGGVSTLIFAAVVRAHTCINPDITANRLIVQFMNDNELSTAGLTFVEGSSDRELPLLRLDAPVDVALIDGSHSFPLPIIDWHYIDPLIRVGGIIFVDNCSINAVKMLCDFLSLDPAYEFSV